MIVYESLVLLYLKYKLCRIIFMYMVNFTQDYSVTQNLRCDMSKKCDGKINWQDWSKDGRKLVHVNCDN